MALSGLALAQWPPKGNDSDTLKRGDTFISRPGKPMIDVMNFPGSTIKDRIDAATYWLNNTYLKFGVEGRPTLYIRGNEPGFDYTFSTSITINNTGRLGFDIAADKGLELVYNGSGPAFKFEGLKFSRVENLVVRLESNNAIGFEFTGHTRKNEIINCDVILNHPTVNVYRQNCIGFVFASTTDVSFNLLRHCDVYTRFLWNSYGLSTTFKGNDLAHIANQGNFGFLILGGDLMANVFDQCTTLGLRVGFAQSSSPGAPATNYPNIPQSGNGLTTYRDCSADYCYVGWHLPGNGTYNLIGGRSEVTGCYVLFGPYRVEAPYESWGGTLNLTNLEFADSRSPLNAVSIPLYLHTAASNSALVDVRTAARINAIGCVFDLGAYERIDENGNTYTQASYGYLAGGNDVFSLFASSLTDAATLFTRKQSGVYQYTPPNYVTNSGGSQYWTGDSFPSINISGCTAKHSTTDWRNAANWTTSNYLKTGSRTWNVVVDGTTKQTATP